MEPYQNQRKKVKRFNRTMQRRLVWTLVAFLACFLALAIRIEYINRTDGQRYAKKVLSQQTYMSNALEYKRGDILDRNNTKLATSKLLYNVIISPKEILEKSEYRTATVNALTSCFDIKESEIAKVLKDKPSSQYSVILKNVAKDDVEKYETMVENEEKKYKELKEDCPIVGVWFEKVFKRTYPLKDSGCSVIGFSSSDNNGLWGIENQYNEELNGVAGRVYGYYNQDSDLERTVKAAENGNSIVSTIDANIQLIAEKKIDKFMKKTGAKNVAALVMNPKNGEIYAMASNTRYDLNNAFDLEEVYSKSEVAKMSEKEKSENLNKMWRNFCVSESYEPGSTFKPLTVAAALEENLYDDNSYFVCDGGQNVAGTPIRCVSRYGHGSLNLQGSLMESCNDVMMQIVAKMGKKTFARYQEVFNIGTKTGIDLPGENMGTVYTEENLGPTELATSSFGQSLTVNMVQIASAISSVVNGGYYYKPHVVKQIVDEDGNVVKNIDGTLVRRTVSGKTSELLRKYLLATVDDGTAATAQIKGYAIGGKTGTAQKQPRYLKNYLVSFIGAAPMDDPEVIVYVIVDEPNVKDQAHSTYAQEVARDIMKDIFPYLGIYPDEELLKKAKKEEAAKAKATSTPEGNAGESQAAATQTPATTEAAATSAPTQGE